MGVDNGARRNQSTPETSARSSNDQRVGFTGDCEGERRSKLIGGPIGILALQSRESPEIFKCSVSSDDRLAPVRIYKKAKKDLKAGTP